MVLNNQSASPAPPSYNDTPAPSLPSRNAKPTVAYARALYRYTASDDRDLSFEKDDKISVLEYMNQDWWMGLNQRTNQEGIFPRNYVLVEQETKSQMPYGQPQQPQYGYPQGPPQQQNPYNANAPPMAVAEEGNSKHGEMGKKVGKKFGSASKSLFRIRHSRRSHGWCFPPHVRRASYSPTRGVSRYRTSN
jgi:hypothetical protein